MACQAEAYASQSHCASFNFQDPPPARTACSVPVNLNLNADCQWYGPAGRGHAANLDANNDVSSSAVQPAGWKLCDRAGEVAWALGRPMTTGAPRQSEGGRGPPGAAVPVDGMPVAGLQPWQWGAAPASHKFQAKSTVGAELFPWEQE